MELDPRGADDRVEGFRPAAFGNHGVAYGYRRAGRSRLYGGTGCGFAAARDEIFYMGDARVHIVAEVIHAAHRVDDVGFEHLAHRAALATDVGHVVVVGVALVAHVPEDRREPVLLSCGNHILVPLHAALLMEVQVRSAQFRGAYVRTELADDDRVALVHVVRLHFGELFLRVADACKLGIDGTSPGVVARIALGFAGFLVVAVVVLRQNRFACAPVILLGHERVLIRVVVVHFEHQAAFDFVFREGAHRGALDGLVDVGVETLNNQCAGGVIATGGAHRVDEGLVVVHQRADVLGSPVVHVRAGLVCACENQAFVVVLELGRNLSPVGLHLGVDGGVHASADVALEPAAFTFVVDVQNRVEARAHRIINDRLYGIKPGLGNLAVACVAVPGAGNADRAETGRLDGIEQRLRGEGVAPGGGVVRHFHGVSDVEAHAHLGLDF